MAKNCPDMKQVLRYGIQAKTEAKEFYMKQAENVEDEAEKMEFLTHSEMERGHEEQLEKYYKELYDQEFARDPDLTIAPELKIQTTDFHDVTSRIGIATSFYTAEMRASEYYKNMINQMGKCEARQMFEKLLQVEKQHLEETKRRYLDLKADIAGFHPF